MMARTAFRLFCAIVLAFVLACGGSEPPSRPGSVQECLPQDYSSLGLVRDGEIMRFAGDTLFDYIDGAAEMYYKYGFQEVHTARYSKEDGEVTVDIYRFAEGDMAFGMYTTLRPESPDTVAMGAEGFAWGPILVFAKPPYMVNLQTYHEDVFTPAEMEALAAAVDKRLPGSSRKPAIFELFPEAGRAAYTEKIFADSFLGRAFLTNVYTVDYSLEGSDFTLFLSPDGDGDKFKAWSEAAASDAAGERSQTARTTPLSGLPFEEGRAALLKEDYYGRIAAGIRHGWLAGIVGFEDGHSDILAGWLETLPPAPQ